MKILILIPCYNESGQIKQLLESLINKFENCDCLVIDDGSTDDSYDIAKNLTSTIQHCINLGIGATIQTGLKYALKHNYDYCLQVDGDGQHPVSEIEIFFDYINKSNVNILIGNRFARQDNFYSSYLRRFGIWLISKYIKLLFKKNITDPTSGFRLFDKKSIKYFSKYYPHDFPEPVSIAMALNTGLKIDEIPIKMKKREHGKSSITFIKSIHYMIRVFAYITLEKFIIKEN